jgi:hypothetical protein
VGPRGGDRVLQAAAAEVDRGAGDVAPGDDQRPRHAVEREHDLEGLSCQAARPHRHEATVG